MDFRELGASVASIAPALGAALGGPVGAGIGLAVKAIASIFGLKADASPDELQAAIQQDPQAAFKLRLAEMDFSLKLRDQDIEEFRLQLADVQSARSKEVEIKKAGGTNIFMYALGAVICIGFFTLTGLLMFRDLPPGSSDTVKFLLTQLATAFLAIVYYLWGTSKSSADKTEIMNQAIKK